MKCGPPKIENGNGVGSWSRTKRTERLGDEGKEPLCWPTGGWVYSNSSRSIVTLQPRPTREKRGTDRRVPLR